MNNLVENGSKKNITIPNNGPLFHKNVIKMKLDQNNINSSNQDPMTKSKPGFNNTKGSSNNNNTLSNLPLEQLNRQHFDAMNSLHSEFAKFKDNHSKLVK